MDEQKLREYFDFDEADLEANRKGRLTDQQKKRFKPKANSDGWSISLIGLFFLFIAGLGLFAAVQFFKEESDWVGRIIFGLGFGVIWPLVWGGIGVAMLKPTKRPTFNPNVKTKLGPLKVIKHETQDSIPYYELRVGDISVETDHDLTNVMEEGDKYAFYYIQTTKQVVSMEKVEKRSK
ncbi:MAG: hypothetical protein C4583_18715 [Anaerolineaceae bacterium]|nr:MAG: hypothetical protein C4583_18715 [Anaerolineaceae bacterium]